MKQIKAFFQPHRINAVTDALRNSGLCDITVGTRCQNITVSNVQRLYSSLDVIQQQYSLSLGEPVVGEIKLELFCEDEVIDELAALITQAAKPGPGWVFVSDIGSATYIV
ncbi:P-II family nitrogen regulator [Noviherbaspirillum suwonense]|uniref:Nitrogen regulatory protein P-II family n=1 Tax=Noviherbaspirillum suwonense TaxID=1224511 RepID=A0ABY1QU96_9BURK|nr:P-II family nitrogen regulator [Noviherbaspirillum suwonense]SMP81049.1 nitrogen regulatory protein P-II family [Noviherbaspirillum suwonense]